MADPVVGAVLVSCECCNYIHSARPLVLVGCASASCAIWDFSGLADMLAAAP